MDIERIRYFHVFAESGSLLKACELLHISQPALSKALKVLQFEVGERLLMPEGRGLRLTSEGIDFKKKTAPLINQWVNLPHLLQSKKEERKIKLGTFEVFSTYFLRKLSAQIDLTGLEISELGPGLLEDAIFSNLVDYGITYLPVPKNGLDFIEVSKIEMGVFGCNKFEGTKWTEMPFVIPLPPISGTPSKVMGLDGWPDHKFKRKINYKVTLMESALELCRGAVAVAYLPKFIVELHNQLVHEKFKLRELDSPLTKKRTKQSVFLIKLENVDETAEFKKIANSLRNLT